jgi:hypothetical protein
MHYFFFKWNDEKGRKGDRQTFKRTLERFKMKQWCREFTFLEEGRKVRDTSVLSEVLMT